MLDSQAHGDAGKAGSRYLLKPYGLNGTFTKKRSLLRKSHWKVAKDAGPAGPSVPPLWHSKSGAFSAFSTLISTSEERKGGIIGIGNSHKPFAFSCRAEARVNLVLRRW